MLLILKPFPVGKMMRFPKQLAEKQHLQIAPGTCINNKTWRGNRWTKNKRHTQMSSKKWATLPETNSHFAPENRPKPKRKLYSLPIIHFQGRAVSFREGIMFNNFHVEQSKHLLFCLTFKESFLIMGIQPPHPFHVKKKNLYNYPLVN